MLIWQKCCFFHSTYASVWSAYCYYIWKAFVKDEQRWKDEYERVCEGWSRQRSGVIAEGHFEFLGLLILICETHRTEMKIWSLGGRRYDTAYIFETFESGNQMSSCCWVTGFIPTPEWNLIAQIGLYFTFPELCIFIVL